MNRRILGISIIVIALAIIAFIVYFIFFYDFNKKTVVAPTATSTSQEETVVNLPTVNTPTTPASVSVNNNITPAPVGQDDLQRIGSAFAERFGSYSNHSNFANIKDLKIFMTAKMQAWADNYIAEQTSATYSGIYYGITTKAVSTKVNKFNDATGTGEILVKTQRIESTGTTSNNKTIYQNILIKFIKERGAWKVDSASWQK